MLSCQSNWIPCSFVDGQTAGQGLMKMIRWSNDRNGLGPRPAIRHEWPSRVCRVPVEVLLKESELSSWRPELLDRTRT